MAFPEVYSVNEFFLSKVRLFIVYNMLRIDKKNIVCLYYIIMPFLLLNK